MIPMISAIIISIIACIGFSAYRFNSNSLHPSRKLALEEFLLLKSINSSLLTDLQNIQLDYYVDADEFTECFSLDKSIVLLKDVAHWLLTNDNYKVIENTKSALQIEEIRGNLAMHINQHIKIRAAYEKLADKLFTIQEWISTAAA